MDFMVVFGVMLLFTEISTTYVSMRWLLYKHDMGKGPLYAINAVAMFVVFLFGRLIYQFYITFWVAGPRIATEFENKNISIYQATVIFEMMTMVVLSIVLNLYWFYLMLKMIGRVIARMNQNEEENIENVELVKADGLKED